jgi:hypothetical protein
MRGTSKRLHRSQRTSLEARDGILSLSAEMRRRVYNYIRGCGDLGACDHEISLALSMPLQTVNPRRGELVTAGLVVNSGRRRATLAGRSAIVWVAAAFSGAA